MPVSALVLGHDPLVGPSTWRGASAGLAAAGYTTVVVDLADAHTPATVTETVVRSVPAEMTRTVLIGHSGAGPFLPTGPLHARIAELVDAAGGEVVRLDTTPVLARRR